MFLKFNVKTITVTINVTLKFTPEDDIERDPKYLGCKKAMASFLMNFI